MYTHSFTLLQRSTLSSAHCSHRNNIGTNGIHYSYTYLQCHQERTPKAKQFIVAIYKRTFIPFEFS